MFIIELIIGLLEIVGMLLYAILILPWVANYEGNTFLAVLGMGFSASMWFVVIGVPLGLYGMATMHSRPPYNTRIGNNAAIPRIQDIDEDTGETIDSRDWEMLCHKVDGHDYFRHNDFIAIFQTDDGKLVECSGSTENNTPNWHYRTDIQELLDTVQEKIGQEAYELVKERSKKVVEQNEQKRHAVEFEIIDIEEEIGEIEYKWRHTANTAKKRQYRNNIELQQRHNHLQKRLKTLKKELYQIYRILGVNANAYNIQVNFT